jgi:signal transduction histidine kinase
VRAWALRKWQTGAALTRQFAFLSFIVIGLITAALSLVISYSLRKDLLEREWRITADFVRTEAFYHLSPADFAASWSPAAQDNFREFYRQTVTMPEIVRVKVYDANMAVVWSDEPRLLGQRFPLNPQLTSALAGRVVVNLEASERKAENIYERGNFPELVEVYVPIVFPGTSRVAGVVETYKMPAQVFANIRQGRITVFGTALAGGAFLYLSLFWIVRRAARRIDEQHQTLEHRSRELASANEELRAAQTQLLQAERMAAIGEVVAAVAHGIRNPLANIRASAQVAGFECGACPEKPATPRHLANIMSEVDRLEGRLKELLQFVRPAERQITPVDLNALLRAALQMMAGRLGKAHVKVEERPAAALPSVLGDAMLIEQVLLSLLGNAVEATPEGGTVTLSTGTMRHDTGALQVFAEVQDTGVGIPTEQIPRIFEPFYTTKAQGTGLGLAIARKYTEAHGGTISVQSRPGEGSTFRVMFPARPEA